MRQIAREKGVEPSTVLRSVVLDNGERATKEGSLMQGSVSRDATRTTLSAMGIPRDRHMSRAHRVAGEVDDTLVVGAVVS